MTATTEKLMRAIMLCKLAHPELRLGQIMFNSIPEGYEKDVFYHADALFARWIDEFRISYAERKK